MTGRVTRRAGPGGRHERGVAHGDVAARRAEPQALPDPLLVAVRKLPARPHVVARVAVRDLLQVVLVLLLGLPELAGRLDLGDDLAGPQPGRVDVRDRVERDATLLLTGVEDRRPVAAADVVALPVLRRRVVDLEEELQQVPEGDLLGIEDDLDRLGVVAVVAVRGVRRVAAGVADAGGDHSRAASQQLLRTPEASAGEDRCLGRGHAPTSFVGTAGAVRRS